MIIWCQDYPKMHLMDEGPGAILSFKTFLSFINRLLETTPVFLPGESQGQRSLVDLRLWGLTELDTLTLLSSSSNSDYVTSS